MIINIDNFRNILVVRNIILALIKLTMNECYEPQHKIKILFPPLSPAAAGIPLKT